MNYSLLTQEQQDQIEQATLLSLEADHFRAQLRKDMAPNGSPASAAISGELAALEDGIARIKSRRPVEPGN
jgi:hypothetical protein